MQVVLSDLIFLDDLTALGRVMGARLRIGHVQTGLRHAGKHLRLHLRLEGDPAGCPEVLELRLERARHQGLIPVIRQDCRKPVRDVLTTGNYDRDRRGQKLLERSLLLLGIRGRIDMAHDGAGQFFPIDIPGCVPESLAEEIATIIVLDHHAPVLIERPELGPHDAARGSNADRQKLGDMACALLPRAPFDSDASGTAWSLDHPAD